MRIALAGNPNSGKTTMYNALTGKNEKVGNWAGVTVEKNEHPIRSKYAGNARMIAVDLPGAYSMSPFTSEESITGDYIRNERPDVLINVVDATNLSRSLFFTTQLLSLGIPTVIALNKTDAGKRKQRRINPSALSSLLHCPVVETVSLTASGLSDLIAQATAVAGKTQIVPYIESNIDKRDRRAVEAADRMRFAFVNRIVAAVETHVAETSDQNRGDRIDELLTNKWLGIPIFAVVMFTVFWISQAGPGVWIANFFTGWLETGQKAVASAIGTDGIWTSILIDGIIGGVIAVVGFLPLVMVMYFLIALLEDCGYMARATVVLDPIFKKVGLSGKSVIPFVIGTGCAVPGVMACRTIRDERERRSTAMLAPFMPCGAKLPVITLFAGAFFTDAAWVGPLMYFVGIVLILLCALLVNKLTGCKSKHSYFIIELPDYKAPSLPRAFASMCQRGWSYVVKAGTVILVCNFIVHVMQTFSFRFTPVTEETVNTSILATVASPFAYFLAPIVGVVAWQLAAAAITGFIAKENVVGTLAVCFGISNLFNLEEMSMIEGGGNEVALAFGITKIAALAYLMFNLFSPPCFAAIGAMNAELRSKRWLFAGLGLQIGVGYSVGFLVYFFGTLFTGADFGALWMPILGFAVVLAFGATLLVLILRQNAKMKAESTAHSNASEKAKV